uniref:T9SS type A sorting domain-containing protein n=1 Tax=candidate division WOR-3 bacterium TaxID=2052148 RepID=A0A7C6AA65_UNCW3
MRYFITTVLITVSFIFAAATQNGVVSDFSESVKINPGQTAPNTDFYSKQGHEPGGITGKVIDVHTRRPIPRALIVAQGPVRREVRTNRHGDYFIGQIPPGSYRVSANAPGYRPCGRESVLVRPNHIVRVNFALEPIPQYGGISGMVTDHETHNPIEHALITIEGPVRAQVETNREGFYIVINLPPGEYRVMVEALGYRPQTRERVPVHPGRITENVNFALERAPLNGMIGKVVEKETNHPIENALIIALGPVRYEARTNRNGDFGLIGIQPGIYRVMAQARGYLSQTLDSVIVYPNRITDHVDFFLQPESSNNIMDRSFSLSEDMNISVLPNPCVQFARINVFSNNQATLKVYDASGKLINTLWQGKGTSSVVWDRTDASGNVVNCGTYFISIENGADRKVAKVIVR